MEADWAAEIGAGLAWIDGDWPGFVDLRAGGVGSLVEAVAQPALRNGLIALNGAGSPVFSVKCDVWNLERGEIDPLEFDCAASETEVGLASWIDVVARSAKLFGSFEGYEGWVRCATDRLRREKLGCGRMDLVIRAAVFGGRDGFGMTLYAAGCGVDAGAARAAWERILGAGVLATMETAPRNAAPGASSSIG